VDLDGLIDDLHRRFDEKTAAREQALPAARRAIRASANAIRATHRGEFETARALIADARERLDEGLAGLEHQPDVRFAGYLLDAEKEYAEACITFTLVRGDAIPTTEDVRVGDAPYLNGMAEAIGEGRRFILDLLRLEEVERAERVLADLEICTACS
jgi:translin